jgi:diaminopimelate decarboxylase
MAEAPAHLGAALAAAGPPWPDSASFGERGLEIGGMSSADLALRFGTPLVVYDVEQIRARCRLATQLFPRALYAVKAFTCYRVIRIALDEGLDLLASSGGEVAAIARAGAAGSRIVLHGNNKTDEELRLALDTGVRVVIVDNAEELERLSRIAIELEKEQDVMVRVRPDIRAETHEKIATGHEGSKFGVSLGEAPAAIVLAGSLPGLRYRGIQFHLGSQLLSADPYLAAIDTVFDLIRDVHTRAGAFTRELDIGGGFGIPYTDEMPPPLQELAHLILGRVHEAAERRGLKVPTISVEPGRWIVGSAGVTLYRVGAIKEAGGRTLVAVDGGMSDNIRPMLYDARYAVAVAGRQLVDAAPRKSVRVVGKHCESGDVLADEVELDASIQTGDLLAFAATGAYTYSMASSYNRIGRPPVVGIASGSPTLWLRREDASDLDRLEVPVEEPVKPPQVPDGIEIRPARTSDAHAFVEFWSKIVAEGRNVRSEEVRHPLRVYRSRFRHGWTDKEAQVVAMQGERMVGHVYVAREEHPVTRHVATLGIAVAADHRREGIGTALMGEALRWARANGVEKIVLSVYPHNSEAIALYRRFGFLDEGRMSRQSRKSYGYEDEILMAVWLGDR